MLIIDSPGVTARFGLAEYKGATRQRLTLADDPSGEIQTKGARVRYSLRGEGRELVLEAEALADCTAEIAAGIWFELPWAPDGYLTMPGAVYAGNRFQARDLEYPCILRDPEDTRPDVPNTISLIPRLRVGPGPSGVEQLAGDMAFPSAGLYVKERNWGLAVWTMPEHSAGQAQSQPVIGFEESDDRNGALLWVSVPGVREQNRFHGGSSWVPSEDRGIQLREGEKILIRVGICPIRGGGLEALFDALLDLRSKYAKLSERRHELPWSAAFQLIEDKYNTVNWDRQYGYYAVGDRQSRYAQWQMGWVGGMISTHALMAAGEAESQHRVVRNLDFATTVGQSPSGFFWSVGIDGEMFSDMVDMDWGHDWHLIRRSGDAIYFMLKQICLAEKQGISNFKLSWRGSLRRCADAFVRLWETEGQFGQFVSQETGQVRVGGTTSGAIVPAGLALAARVLQYPRYLEVARISALAMGERFLQAGYTSGGPGEAAQCPDSESAFGLLESYVTLFEETGSEDWLKLAGRAADLCSTWVMPYDFRFPPDSTFGKLNMQTSGSVWANAQNKHSAPGICTLSGVSLFKLYRATGDERYLDLIQDIGHGITQYLSRDDRPVFGMPSGYMCERVNTSDWEHPRVPVGEGFAASCWCEVSAMLTYAELPGLYVQPDTGMVVPFDHIDLTSVGRVGEEFVVGICNPTRFPMRLRYWSERSADMGRPLGQDFMIQARWVDLDPGAKTQIQFRL